MKVTMKRLYFLLMAALIATSTFAQATEDTTDERFHDTLLNHLVGEWNGAGLVHGEAFTMKFEASWVMNHQYLHIHFKSNEDVPWLHMPFECELFFGYNQTYKKYIAHEMTVHGDSGPYEGFCYAYQTGNEFKLIKKVSETSDTISIERFTWEPMLRTWQMNSSVLIKGKQEEALLDIKLTGAKPSSN